jgi:multidrug resistance efflux pump/predicted small secreted protein
MHGKTLTSMQRENAMKKIVPLTVLMLFVGSSLSACGNSAQAAGEPTLPADIDSAEIIAEGRLEPVRFSNLALNTSGLVTEVLSAEGDQVQAGQVIARLENAQAKTLESAQADSLRDLTGAFAAVRDAQYLLDNFDAPSDFSELTPIQAVKTTLEKLNKSRDNFEPYKNLSDKWLAPYKREIDTGVYRDVAKRYKKELDDAWADYRRAVQWLNLESYLETAQARLDRAQKDYEDLQDPAFSEGTAGARAALANAELRAPIAGTITNLDLKVGEFVPAGQPVVTIADLSSWVVQTTDLTEIDVINLSEAQPVEVTLDAMPDITLGGIVLSIGESYFEKEGDIVYEVTILLNDENPAMRWGMTAEVKFVK